jgi:hypothetical protein
MEKPAYTLFINRAQPVYECDEPDEAPHTADYAHMRDENEVAIYSSDLTEHGMRGQLLRLYDALCYGVLRAFKRECVFRLVDKWEMVNFNHERPDSNEKLNAVPVVWGPSRKPGSVDWVRL